MFTNDHFIGIYKAQGRQIYGVYLPSLTTDIFWNSLTAAHFSGCMDLFPKFKFLRVDGTGFMHSQRLKEEVKEQLFMEDVDEAWMCNLESHRHAPRALTVLGGAGTRKGSGGRDCELGTEACSPCAEISRARL